MRENDKINGYFKLFLDTGNFTFLRASMFEYATHTHITLPPVSAKELEGEDSLSL